MADARRILESWCSRHGEIFARFDQQDSGNQGYGFQRGHERCFIKLAAPRHAHTVERVAQLHAEVQHEAIVPQRGFRPLQNTNVAWYPWVDAHCLYPPTGDVSRRFRRLPLRLVLDACTTLLDVHQLIEAAGWIAVDLYDGACLYDFTQERLFLCDLDEYRKGTFRLDTERLPGSRRFMAPEEFQRGATIDARTMVHQLGAALRVFLEHPQTGPRQGTALAAMIEEATSANPKRRYASVTALAAAFGEARRTDAG